VLLLALGGCGKPPAFEVHWFVADATDGAPLQAKQCSDVGIFSVRVTVELGDEDLTIEEPCFVGAAEVPALEPGEYEVVVEGLRRSGEPWGYNLENGSPVAWAKETVVVSEEMASSVGVVLFAPEECDDGIDNDRDGVVDTQDPGCDIIMADVAQRESNDAELTLFQISVSFLDSPVVKPYNVGVSAIQLEIDGQPFEQFADYELDLTQWPFRLPLISGEFEPGEYELSITALGPDGAVTQTLIDPEQPTFVVQENTGGYEVRHFDFTSERFLAPIIQPLRLDFIPDCTPGDSLLLKLDRVWLRVVDDMGMVVPSDSLMFMGNYFGGMGIVPQPETDGWISFECPSSTVTSLPLTWGGYEIEARATLANVTCYSMPLMELAPQPVSAQTLTLERELTMDGLPACAECLEHSHCQAKVCVDGLCVDKEPGQ
jgi:hypothetical protein